MIKKECTEIQESVIEDISQEVQKCTDSYFSRVAGVVQPSQPPAGVALVEASRGAQPLQMSSTGTSAQLLLTFDAVQPEHRQINLKRSVKSINFTLLAVDP